MYADDRARKSRIMFIAHAAMRRANNYCSHTANCVMFSKSP